MTYRDDYLRETVEILAAVDLKDIDRLAGELIMLKSRAGRLFILGNGGSAANASHAVNDFRKICKIESYTPTDNVAELTAWTNDEGWSSSFVSWLKGSNLHPSDAVLALSVGGGSNSTSQNIVMALAYARMMRTPILSIVGRDGGFTKSASTVCVLIPTVCEERVTPHVEELQGVILHLLANHPRLQGGV